MKHGDLSEAALQMCANRMRQAGTVAMLLLCGLVAARAYDRRGDLYSFASEWVMVARRAEDLQFLLGPPPAALAPQAPANQRRGAAGFKFELRQ